MRVSSMSRVNTRPGERASEREQDLELDEGERDRRAPDRHGALGGIDAQRVRAQERVVVGDRLGHARPAHRRLHPRAELAHGERLGDVVVGAELEAQNRVDLLRLRGEHDDRDRAARPQPAADLEAVHPGHHRVEHHQVERLLAEAGERLAAVGGAHDLVAVLLQRVAQQRLDGLLVVGQQDAQGAVGHGVTVRAPPG